MTRAFDLLFCFEQKLREHINQRMTTHCGVGWERHRCHGNGTVYKKWVEKRDRAVQSGLKAERLIDYADFTEHADLISRSDNWSELFKPEFVRPENVRGSFHRLGPVRLNTMHARPITKWN